MEIHEGIVENLKALKYIEEHLVYGRNCVMKPIVKITVQFVKYFIVGGIAFLVDTFTLFTLTDFLDLNYLLSAIFGFSAGLISNYLLGIRYVFKESGKANLRDFKNVTIIGIIGLLLTVLGMYIFVDLLKVYYLLSKLIVAAVVLIWNYGARKVFIYSTYSNKRLDVYSNT